MCYIYTQNWIRVSAYEALTTIFKRDFVVLLKNILRGQSQKIVSVL